MEILPRFGCDGTAISTVGKLARSSNEVRTLSYMRAAIPKWEWRARGEGNPNKQKVQEVPVLYGLTLSPITVTKPLWPTPVANYLRRKSSGVDLPTTGSGPWRRRSELQTTTFSSTPSRETFTSGFAMKTGGVAFDHSARLTGGKPSLSRFRSSESTRRACWRTGPASKPFGQPCLNRACTLTRTAGTSPRPNEN